MSDEELINFYVCYDDQQLQRVVQMLEAADVETLVRDRSSNAFPTNIQQELLVAVDRSSLDRARKLLKTAMQDGVISDEGSLL